MTSMPETKEEMESFAIRLTDESTDHDAWLTIIKYGQGTLIENQPLFIEIIVREAMKQLDRKKITDRVPSDEVRQIFTELGLKLTLPER